MTIDYDGTITEDPEMFMEMIFMMKRFGHTPIIVTMRYPHEEDNFLNAVLQKDSWDIPVYYTGRKAKKPFMAELGIFPSIWIDDNPHWINEDSI